MSRSHAKASMSSAVSLSASPAISHNCQRGNSWAKNIIMTEIINYFKQEKIPSQTRTTQQLNHVKAVWEVGLVRCSSDRLTGVTYLYSNMGTKTPFSVQFPQSKQMCGTHSIQLFSGETRMSPWHLRTPSFLSDSCPFLISPLLFSLL